MPSGNDTASYRFADGWNFYFDGHARELQLPKLNRASRSRCVSSTDMEPSLNRISTGSNRSYGRRALNRKRVGHQASLLAFVASESAHGGAGADFATCIGDFGAE